MIGLLFSHWEIWGVAGVAIIACLAIGLLGGWSLVLNRYVLGLLAAVLAFVAAGLAWEAAKAHYRAEGAALLVAANDRAKIERQRAIAEWVVDHSKREAAAIEQRRLAEQRLDLERDARQKERKAAYAKADAACTIPLRFVRDHDTVVPRAGRSAAVPLPAGPNFDLGSGIPLSGVTETVDHNYSECTKLVERVRDADDRRYQDCVAWDQRFGINSGCQKQAP